MDKNAIKKYAVWARRELISRVAQRAALYEIKKIIRSYNRAVIFPTKTLTSAADVDDYVEKLREQLKSLLQNCDGIQLK